MNGDLYKMARKAARKAAADAGYAFKSGWKRVGAHNQAQAADLIDAGGRPKGAALAWPGGAWTVYSGGAVIAEGQEGAR